MKKFLAMLIALMMLTVTCVAGAESAAHITTTVEYTEEFANLLGMPAEIIQMVNNSTSDLLITQNGFSATSLYKGEALVDYSIELQDSKLYIGSSLLDQPLYLDLADVAKNIPQLAPFLVDWNGLMTDLGNLNFNFDKTTAAAMKVTIIRSGDTTIIAVDQAQLCEIIDALAGDLLATNGLEAVLNKYLGVTDLATVVYDAADQLKAVCANLNGSVVITYTYNYSSYSSNGASLSVNVPLRSATWTLNCSQSSVYNNGYERHTSASLVYAGYYETREYSYTQDYVNYESTEAFNVNETYDGEKKCMFNLTVNKDGVTGLYRPNSYYDPYTFAIVATENGGKLTVTNSYGVTVEGILTLTDNGFKVTLGTAEYTLLTAEGYVNNEAQEAGLTVSINNGNNTYEKVALVLNQVDQDTIAIKVLYNDKLLATENVTGEYIEFEGELVPNKGNALNILTLTYDQQSQITETMSQKLMEKLPEDLKQLLTPSSTSYYDYDY